jgi:AraC-like DNA-binding protein
MNILQTNIATLQGRLVQVEQICDPLLCCRFHAQPEYHSHPEAELLYIVKGSGKRIINGTEAPFTSGDLVLLGPNVPHVWLVDTNGDPQMRANNESILLYLNMDTFGSLFQDSDAFSGIEELLNRRSSGGLQVLGETNIHVAAQMKALMSIEGFEKVQGVLSILHQLSVSDDLVPIYTCPTVKSRTDRPDPLLAVMRHVHNYLQRDISLAEVAALACMTQPSFCRFFKNRMKKTFSAYLLEQRLRKSQQLLLHTDQTIGEIARACGYPSLSHFCKIFKKSYQHSPAQFRRNVSPPVARSA